MVSQTMVDPLTRSRHFWLTAAALIIGGVVFAPIYVLLAIHPFLAISFRVVPDWYQFLVLSQFTHALLFSHAATYLLISLLGIGVALMALLWARPHWVIRVLLILTMLAIIVGCTQSPATTSRPTDAQTARETLILFFSLLHDQRYSDAVNYYDGGTYDTLRDWNPGVDDFATMFKSACTFSGLQCLKIRAILREEQATPTEFRFTVQFTTDDGTLFKRGPCCGATETEMPTQTEFPYTVKKVDNRFLVQEMPVYVP
jgi:hypothetical protein